MVDRWMVTIEAWPHSTGNGQEADQKLAGERSQNFAVRAIDISAALELAEAIAQGMRTNPMVWRAPIMAIIRSRECAGRTSQISSTGREIPTASVPAGSVLSRRLPE